MIDGKTAEQWRDGFFNAPAMTYAEALLWIATRNADTMAEVFTRPHDPADDRATMIEGTYALTFPDEWREHRPEEALTAALEAGKVVAIGCPLLPVETRSGLPRVLVERVAAQPIAQTEWLTLKIADAHPCERETVAAVPKRQIHGQMTLRGWGDLYFLSPGIWQTFPNGGGVGKSHPKSFKEAVPSWHPRPGEKQKGWVARPDVLAEADSRLAGGYTKKQGRPGVLWEMAKEAGLNWSTSGLRNAYAEVS